MKSQSVMIEIGNVEQHYLCYMMVHLPSSTRIIGPRFRIALSLAKMKFIKLIVFLGGKHCHMQK